MVKRGQIKISFSMIFSIILVIVFLAFGFYAIKTWLNFQNEAKAGKFIDDLQKKVTTIWENSQSSDSQEYLVPSGREFVCFVDFDSSASGENSIFYSELKLENYGTENLVFYPVKSTRFESATINHLDIEKTTSEDNPLCIEIKNGKVSLLFQKEFGENLVTIVKED